MKKVALACAMLLAFSAVTANAAGLKYRWNSCYGDGGVQNRTSACTANTGSNVMVASFELASDVIGATGIETIVDGATAGTALPAWWTTTCRTGFMSANPTISPSAANCFEWAAGIAGGLGAWRQGLDYGPSSGRAIMAFATATPTDVFAAAGEYFAFNLVVSNAKSSGTGSCAGCSTPACLSFSNVKMVAGTKTGAIINTAAAAGSNYVTWQGGAGVSSNLGSGCPAATPTRNASWSSVKSLYR